MGLGVRPEAHAAAFHALGEPSQIALEGVEIDDQCRGVDLIEAHANLGGWARRHRWALRLLGTAAGLPMGWRNATRPLSPSPRRSGPSIPRVGIDNIPRHDARELARRWPDRPRLKRPHREEKTMAEAMVSGAEDALEKLGIGGAVPRAATLTGDYAPRRYRATMIMATFTGAPVGGFICGQLAGVLLPSFGWPSVYLVGGIVPLLLVVALALWLPESPRFLATKGNLTPRETALLQRLDIRPGQSAATIDVASGNPIKMLFGGGY